MMIIPVEWLAFGAIAIALCSVIALLRINKRLTESIEDAKTQQQQLHQQIDTLTQQLGLLNKGTLGMGKRLMNAEKRLNQTMERQESLESKEAEQLSFKQAAKLFERGLEMDNVIEKVGITHAEAKLVDMFQQKQTVDLED